MIETYLHLTKVVLPQEATSARRDWPIYNDHCFQRVILDTVCGGVWYNHIAKPAYKNMTSDQTRQAVDLCHAILNSTVDLRLLNDQSKRWRAEAKRVQSECQQKTFDL